MVMYKNTSLNKGKINSVQFTHIKKSTEKYQRFALFSPKKRYFRKIVLKKNKKVLSSLQKKPYLCTVVLNTFT